MTAKTKIDNREVIFENGEWVFTDNNEPVITYEAFCMDCHKPYKLFELDTTLPDEQWLMIHPSDGGVLCANCIVARASKLHGAIAIRAYIDFGDNY